MSKSTLPMRVFEAEVVATATLSPTMRRIVLGGPGLAGYQSTGVGDEYVRLILPAERGGQPILPAITDGELDYGSVDLDLMRTYTLRSADPAAGTVTIDFVLHAHGVATTWAATAQAGDKVGLNTHTPTSLYSPPEGIEWQILVSDLAGLPALARVLEQTPPTIQTRVVIEVPAQSDQIDLPAHPRASVTWIHGGNGISTSRLDEIVTRIEHPEGIGYVWVAGESRALRGARRHLRRELGLPHTSFKAVGYWIDQAENWLARYDALDEKVRSELDGMWTQDRDEDEIEEEYDERLTALGL